MCDCDDNYLKEALLELGIDLDNLPKRQSRLPRNKFGIPVIKGLGIPNITEYDKEYYGDY